jgi:hypothetical protein
MNRILYKCRLCGEIYSCIAIDVGALDIMIELTNTGNLKRFNVDMIDTHYCENKDYGLADFAGIRKGGLDDQRA